MAFLSQVIQERHKRKREGNYVPVKKDLLDLLMDMYDEETDSRMDDEELRSQVWSCSLSKCLCSQGKVK